MLYLGAGGSRLRTDLHNRRAEKRIWLCVNGMSQRDWLFERRLTVATPALQREGAFLEELPDPKASQD